MVEHWSRKPGVMGSTPIGGIFSISSNQTVLCAIKCYSQLTGFEPVRAEPIGFQVQRLNHSATTADPCSLLPSTGKIIFILYLFERKKLWRCGGLNPGPFTCKANALPLSYIPSHAIHTKISIGISQY